MSDVFTGRLRDEVSKALKAICEVLMDKDNLLELDVSDNAFGPTGAAPLVPFLQVRRSLRTLRINNNGLGPEGGRMIADALYEAARANEANNQVSNLRTIIIGRNRLENGSSEAFARAFAAHSQLREVRMPQNGIRPDGIVTLLGGLDKCTALRYLDLQDNTFTTKGAMALAAALPAWSELERLNIGDCMLNPDGALEVAKALNVARPSLLYLNMTYAEMDDKGALTLAGALLSMPGMKQLELDGNRFKNDGAAADAIRDALFHHNNEKALGSLSDMEEESEEEEEPGEESEEEKEKNQVDALTEALAKKAII
jgi:Ran GTPase-activating protein 1